MRWANFDELLRPCLSSIFSSAPPPDRGLPFHQPAAPLADLIPRVSYRFVPSRSAPSAWISISPSLSLSLSRRWIIFYYLYRSISVGRREDISNSLDLRLCWVRLGATAHFSKTFFYKVFLNMVCVSYTSIYCINEIKSINYYLL